MYDDKQKTQVKITKKSIKSINKNNYCIGKAITMSKNKKYDIAQTINENYRRWYKISLPKTQELTIYGYSMDEMNDGFYALYDSNYNELGCVYNYNKKTIKARGKQKKGTYYFVVYECSFREIADNGKYYSIGWK